MTEGMWLAAIGGWLAGIVTAILLDLFWDRVWGPL